MMKIKGDKSMPHESGEHPKTFTMLSILLETLVSSDLAVSTKYDIAGELLKPLLTAP